jgi:hypothetical protein
MITMEKQARSNGWRCHFSKTHPPFYSAGYRITPVLIFGTGLPLHWVEFNFETGFELSSSWRALPCYGADLNRNILDFMK